MFIIAAAAGLLVGLLLKGKLANLFAHRIRYIYLPVVSLLMLFPANTVYFANFFSGERAYLVFYYSLLRYGLLLLFVLLNLHLWPISFIGAGMFSNAVVTLSNGGRMPVSSTVLSHFAGSETLTKLMAGHIPLYIEGTNARLMALGDLFYIPSPFNLFMSIGDMTVAFGIFFLLPYLMKKKPEQTAPVK